MANALGYVSETKIGFEGALAMMNLAASIRIEKNGEKTTDSQPEYRVYAKLVFVPNKITSTTSRSLRSHQHTPDTLSFHIPMHEYVYSSTYDIWTNPMQTRDSSLFQYLLITALISSAIIAAISTI